MSNLALMVAIPVGTLVVVASIYLVSLGSRYRYTSVLKCPRCQRTFDYEWVPAMSFTAARLGRNRYIGCPLCHEWSTFNLWDTRKRSSGA